MSDNQYFERKRKNQEIADKMLSILRLKLEKLEKVEGLDVTIQLGKPLRNDSAHFTANFVTTELMAYFSFWSYPIVELSAMRLRDDKSEPEYIFTYSDKLDKIDDAQPHMDKIIDLFLDED